MNSRENSGRPEQIRFERKNWIVRAWMPWLLVHLYVTVGALTGDNFVGGIFGMGLYIVLSWVGAVAVAVLFIANFLVRRTHAKFYMLTIVLLIIGPILTTLYAIPLNYSKSMKTNRGAAEVERLCAERGGTNIYRTVENVEGVFQIVPQPSFTADRKSQFGRAYPWNRAMGDQDKPSLLLMRDGKGYLFLEVVNADPKAKKKYTRYLLEDSGGTLGERDPNHPHPLAPTLRETSMETDKLKSRYGWRSEDLTTRKMRRQWIGGGKISVIELATGEVLAEQTGFFLASGNGRYVWGAQSSHSNRCPKNARLNTFLNDVLKPSSKPPGRDRLNALKE